MARKKAKMTAATSTSLVVVALVLVLLVEPSGGSQLESNDIQTFLRSLDNEAAAAAAADGGGQVDGGGWGVPDATATVGKLFSYALPRGESNKAEYKVSELGRDALPAWLHLDAASLTLEGVPGPEHSGLQHYMEVTALGPLAEVALARARDMFTISVKPDAVHVDSPSVQAVPVVQQQRGSNSSAVDKSALTPIRCPHGSSVTMATVILDVDMAVLRPGDKSSLLRRLCGHLQMPAELLRLLPVGNKPMFDSAALVAGPGDVKTPRNPGATVQWEVGCGNVHAEHMPILQALESTSSDGSMSQAVGHGVVGWHVTNNKPPATKRLRRAVRAYNTVTAQPTVGPPTRQLVPTRVVRPDEPSIPVVVTMASPTFFPSSKSEVRPTRKHKHPRPTKTKGRHHKTRKHSPKPQRTRTVAPSVAVPVINPTRVVDISPTVSLGRVSPSDMPVASPGISRSIDVLQPSIQLPTVVMTSMHGPTEVLPTLPSMKSSSTRIITSGPIQPTATDETITKATQPPEVLPPTDRPDVIVTDPRDFNYAPILKNDIQRLEVQVGELFSYRIPKDTFHDFEDGNSRRLKLVFLTVDGLTVPRTSWVKFNQDEQRLYGLPLRDHEGRQEYMMAAIDDGGKLARDPFEIVVSRRPLDVQISHELSLTLDLDYSQFLVDVERRLDVASKIVSIYGDRNPQYMTVTRVDSGSVVYAWTNNSLPAEPCPTRAIAALVAKLLTENDTLNEEAVEKMRPYRVLRAGAERKGACADSDEGADNGVYSKNDDGGGKEVASRPHETSNNEILITTVVPAVIIAAMLLMAALIACFLYRKKRSGKLSDEDQHTFINKGIPIIFADELDEKPDASSKPLIMAEEKPPLPPPEYPRSASGSVPSTPGSSHKEPLLLDSPPYQPPPPPVSGTNGSHGGGGVRSRATQPYRQPYVQP